MRGRPLTPSEVSAKKLDKASKKIDSELRQVIKDLSVKKTTSPKKIKVTK